MAKDKEKSSKAQTAPESLDDYITRLSSTGRFKEKSPTPGAGFVFTGVVSEAAQSKKKKAKR